MAYIRKTRDYWDIQTYTGGAYGWETVCTEETWKEAKQTVKDYRENMPQYSHRIKKYRERIEPEEKKATC